MLLAIQNKVLRSNIFISGAAKTYSPRTERDSLTFVHKLSYSIASKGYKIVSGVGHGIGGAVINGATEYVFSTKYRHLDNSLILRPFPQMVTGSKTKEERNFEYRNEMLKHAGIAIFVFGNKDDGKGGVVLSSGMLDEFEIAIKNGVVPIPVGSTGYTSEELWKKVTASPSLYYPNNSELLDAITQIGNSKLTDDELINQILKAISILQNQF